MVSHDGAIGVSQPAMLFCPHSPIQIFKEQKVSLIHKADVLDAFARDIKRSTRGRIYQPLHSFDIGLSGCERVVINGLGVRSKRAPPKTPRMYKRGIARRNDAAPYHSFSAAFGV